MNAPKKPLPKAVQWLLVVAALAVLGDTPLDQFVLVDAAGTAPVFFDPTRFPAPHAGAHVKLTASVVEQKVSHAPRLVVSKLEAL